MDGWMPEWVDVWNNIFSLLYFTVVLKARDSRGEVLTDLPFTDVW